MKAQIGEIVSLYYDSPRIIQPGEYLQTGTGRSYLLMTIRRQAKGQHIGRWIIKEAMVVDRNEIPPGAVIHPIRWYRRGRKNHVSRSK
jgi:hypothetical protein